MNTKTIARQQLAQRLAVLKSLLAIHRPAFGWLRAIRDTLGISGSQLAKRMDVSKQRISALEKAEIDGAATLNSMRQAAVALDCDFVYALVPRKRDVADKVLTEVLKETEMDEVDRIKSPEYARAIARICRRYHVKSLGLFGSAARRELTPESDIDLLAKFEPGNAPALSGLMAMQQELTRLFGRKTDVATDSILQNPFRRKAIMRELEEIYAA